MSQSNAAVLFLFLVLALSYKENLMKVCLMETIQHSRERFWKMYKESTSTETLDKNKKTLIIVFRFWHFETNGQSLRKSFEVMNEMFIFNSFFVQIKYLHCQFVFFVLETTGYQLFFNTFTLPQNAKVWKSKTSGRFVWLVKRKLDLQEYTVFLILQFVFVSTTNGSSVQNHFRDTLTNLD